ncbi:type II toxin-antitoxin system Phd/YefM family antitoxin [Desulfotalea psychrophila]|jgi:prevent-host-death family protein|uniref:Antitoxin n=1 Tax=Desulfotalea psychrophila TaxID=84980 RepID=A0ABS3AU83_9BACT|nr:type II toxin-antitoxin system Phd/YefM family antitoxin [Desulfocapsa sp.]MBN4068311.1 type II toxin-antitoxin system Phd/YefM family antitoxin [Desulfotalea psychrophila]MBN4071578.1 type II toxin-antitoxin system Phd/YefM family antitoxin [Desulfotalea psychrophila]
MQYVTVQQARKDMSRLLDAVVGGDQVIITRRNKPVATLSSIANNNRKENIQFPDRTAFRKHLPRAKASSVQLVRQMRDEK